MKIILSGDRRRWTCGITNGWGGREGTTSIRFLICATLLFTASWVLPSPTIVVVSLVRTTLEAYPRTSFPALSKVRPTSSLITVPVNQLRKYISYHHLETKKIEKRIYTLPKSKAQKLNI